MKYSEYLESVDKSKILAQTITFSCPECFCLRTYPKDGSATDTDIIYPCVACNTELIWEKDRIYIRGHDLEITDYHPGLTGKNGGSYLIPKLDFNG